MSTAAGANQTDRDAGRAAPQDPTSVSASAIQNPPSTATRPDVDIFGVSAQGMVEQNIGTTVECDADELQFLKNSMRVEKVHHKGEGEQNISTTLEYRGDIRTPFDLATLVCKMNDIVHEGKEGKQKLGPTIRKIRSKDGSCRSQ
ncbi:hypothetical protein NLG97_g10441 [Lecanicillium saksenae]|uniref:Uncharacterized protein n=1 Tax=Lecanicillium saksenae TaxID=468837 RepID=A0ACC1QDP5_9HYPO|nr:hypothetical protein NLG97_g10441 [Lecanicillium saksenae]